MFYRKRMEERSIQILEAELAEKEAEIVRLTEQNNLLRTANHKTNHRLAALEQSVGALLEKTRSPAYNMEAAEEWAVTMEDIQRLSQEYREETGRVKGRKPLPLSKIKMIDDLFAYFDGQCAENGITFHLRINGSIPYMVEQIISQSKLETLIGDHLQDALIAVKSGTPSVRSILAVLGLAEGAYELTVWDTGIPFEPDTLSRLGTEPVTTHAGTGGSGIGFMTTFETLRACKASLIIREKPPGNADYTKSVTIRFDGKTQYIIETYRPDAFPEQSGRYRLISTAEN